MSTPWGVFLLHGKDMTMRWQRGDGDHGDQAPPHLPLEKEENKNSSSSLIEGVWKTREPIHNPAPVSLDGVLGEVSLP